MTAGRPRIFTEEIADVILEKLWFARTVARIIAYLPSTLMSPNLRGNIFSISVSYTDGLRESKNISKTSSPDAKVIVMVKIMWQYLQTNSQTRGENKKTLP